MAGSRKEYELLFKLKAALGGNFNSTFQAALKNTKELQGTIQKVNSMQSKIGGYQKQTAAIAANKDKLAELNAEHEKLQQEMNQTEQPSESLRKKFERNQKQIEQTTRTIEEQERQLGELGDDLRRAGVNTDNLQGANDRLKRSYDALKKSQEEYARISAAQQKNNEAIAKTKGQLMGTVGALVAMGGAIYAGPIKAAADFEAQMSTVQAISGASAADLARLAAEAKKMGIQTQFSATEAGKAMEYMAMAGWKTEQMIGGLPGIMNLAAASGEDLGAVSDIVTDALTAFGMTAEDAARFADVLAQASSNSNTNVAMMGATFQKVAPVAGALGYTVEDMSLGIGLMANASIKAEVAGTSLKTALANMAKPTKQQAAYMQKYGISLTHADGSMKTFAEVVENLRTNLGGLSETEQVAAATAIFGKESFAGMLAIVNTSDADFQKLSDSVNNAAGAAERMAKIKLDNFEGKVTLAKSAFEGLQIALGDALLPTFTDAMVKLTEVIQKMADFASANPELVRQIVKVVGGLLLFKAGTLGLKLGFLELKGGVLGVQKVVALFKGKIAQAGVESIGLAGKLKTAGSGVLGYFKNVGGAVGNLFSGSKIGTAVLSIGSKLKGGVLGAFTSIGGKVTGIFGKLGGLIANGPLGKLGSIIGKGLGSVKTFLAPVTNVLSTAFAPLGKLGSTIFGGFGGVLGKILPIVGVIGLIVAAVQILKDHLDEVRAFIGRVFGDAGLEVFDKIVSVITNVGETIKNVFSEGNLSGARDFIRNIFGENGVAVFDGLINILQTVWGVVQGFCDFINTNVKPIVEDIFGFIVNTVLPMIAQKFAEWAPTISSIIEGLWTVISAIATQVMNVVNFLMPTIKAVIGTAIDSIMGIIGGLLNVIKGVLDFVVGVFTGDWKKAWEGVKTIFGGVWEALKALVKAPLNFIISGINTLIRGLNKLKIPDWVPGIGGKGINIPEIPQFAKGTNRTPDTFIAGERGPELITGAANRAVFTAAQTGQIMNNINNTRTEQNSYSEIKEVVMLAPALQAILSTARAAAEAGGLNVPKLAPATVAAGTVGGTTINIYNQPTIQVDGERPDDLDEKLKKNNEDLLNQFDERLRKRDDDERRWRYG